MNRKYPFTALFILLLLAGCTNQHMPTYELFGNSDKSENADNPDRSKGAVSRCLENFATRKYEAASADCKLAAEQDHVQSQVMLGMIFHSLSLFLVFSPYQR